MVKWFFRGIGLLIVIAGVFFLLKDLYFKKLDASVLVEHALAQSLQANVFRYQAHVDIQGKEKWRVDIQDGIAQKIEDLFYSTSGEITLTQIGTSDETNRGLSELYVLKNDVLSLSTQKPLGKGAPQKVFLIPLMGGWVGFATARDYQDVIWDTYFPNPLRAQMRTNHGKVFNSVLNMKVFRRVFNIDFIRWARTLSGKTSSDYRVNLDADVLFGEIQKLYEDITQHIMSEKEEASLQHVLESMKDWDWVISVNDSGLIESVAVNGEWTDGEMFKLHVYLSDYNNEDLGVSQQFAPPYRKVLENITGVSKEVGYSEDPNKHQEFFDSLDVWSLTNDADSDGLVDAHETFFGTDPHNPDTDGDGFSDYDEIKNGFSPYGEGELYK